MITTTTTAAQTLFSACEYCDGNHGKRCPQVKAIHYRKDGSVKRVELVTAADYTIPWVAPSTPAPYVAPYWQQPNISYQGASQAINLCSSN